MRLIVADCTVNYSGRLDAHLARAQRLIMMKSDGCVAIHSDGGAYKPMNWMNAPNRVTEGKDQIIVKNPDDEMLTIDIHELISDSQFEFGTDPGLQKDGVEAHLQELLAIDPEEIEIDLTLVKREYPTNVGPVDLLCRDSKDENVAIEIKRRGEIDGVEQLTRYLHFLNQNENLAPVRGIFVAQQISPQAKTLAKDRNIDTCEVDYDKLRGIEKPQQALF